MRTLNEIIIHCTATRPEWMAGSRTHAKVAEVRKWHVEDNGWSDIGYHYLIDRDGTVFDGRPVEKSGAHTKGHNANSIGIALFGGFDSSEDHKFLTNFTIAQDKALYKLVCKLATKHDITKVSGHNDYAPKACPGFNVNRWLGE